MIHNDQTNKNNNQNLRILQSLCLKHSNYSKNEQLSGRSCLAPTVFVTCVDAVFACKLRLIHIIDFISLEIV
jgi:hypothetical protein